MGIKRSEHFHNCALRQFINVGCIDIPGIYKSKSPADFEGVLIKCLGKRRDS